MNQLPEFAVRIAGLSSTRAHEVVEKGFRLAEVLKVAESLEFTGGDTARLLNIPVRTLQRWKESNKVLDVGASGRFYRFNAILNQAVQTFKSLQAAREWLRDPQQALDFRTPIEMMKTDPGMSSVEKLLGRIQHGVYT